MPPGAYRPVRPISGGGSWTSRIVAFFGGFWDWAPWIFILAEAGLAGARAMGWFPEGMLLMAEIGMVFFRLFMLFWIIVDVIDRGSAWYWILSVFCCGFLGLLLYMVLGRGD